ncbi:exopolysaccharide biosynthesis GT4 family glycosyltransferase EpsE [Flavimaricola marinus]|uniref:exopolysaccharide biosynthesis GT4 family glycosyltransferase EpsE n=1 Tax=Flavimaricola marinus TaxID=1819565 RepID=UPI000B8AAE36
MKLGYLVPQFPGQTHMFFWREVKELEQRGATVTLFSTRPPPKGLISHDWSQAAIERTEYLGQIAPLDALAALTRLPYGRIRHHARQEPRAFLRDLALAAPAARRLTRSCKAQGIGHVHVHSCGRAALIAALARHMGGPSYSLTLHGPLHDYGPGQRFKWEGAAFATIITDKLIAEMQAEMPESLPDRIFLQPMGVDVDRLQRDTPYVAAQPGEPIRLFSCGRLNIVKGHQDLMEAVRLLLDAGTAVTLDIAGEDDAGGSGFRQVLEQRIRDLGLTDHVRLLGAIDEAAVRDQILNAHAFVLASYAEPLGVALMEAMSCETPTIGTNAGGVAELITDGQDGLLVPPQDPPALAAAIGRLAGDPGLCTRLGAAGRARIVGGFTAGRGAQTLIDAITAHN